VHAPVRFLDQLGNPPLSATVDAALAQCRGGES